MLICRMRHAKGQVWKSWAAGLLYYRVSKSALRPGEKHIRAKSVVRSSADADAIRFFLCHRAEGHLDFAFVASCESRLSEFLHILKCIVFFGFYSTSSFAESEQCACDIMFAWDTSRCRTMSHGVQAQRKHER